jgi:hypothetical protein
MIRDLGGSWPAAVDHPEQLLDAFGGEVPGLQDAEIDRALLRFDEPSLALRFVLAGYPSDPPAAWGEEPNAVHVEIVFFPVRDISVTRWRWPGQADLSLARDANGVQVRLDGPDRRLSVRAEAALMSFWPYIDWRRIPH